MRKEMARLIELDREQALVGHIEAVLGWDQETYMPVKAIEERSEQIAFLEGVAHEKRVSSEIGDLLSSLGSSAENPMGDSSLLPEERAYLRVLRRSYDQETKLPADLVMDLARTVSLAQAAWAEARAKSDFPAFAPYLEKMIELSKRKAACLGPEKPPYDVLLDLYEPGSTEASVGAVFASLRGELVSLLEKIRARPQVDDSFLSRPCDAARQAAISQWMMDVLSFDKGAGRLDTVEHPFTTTLGERDVRITTRYLDDAFASSLFSTIHESGHALYELGIEPPNAFRRTKLAEAASMAVHESQSRLWENMVGRSASFWTPLYPRLQELSGDALRGVSSERFVKAINKVEPSLIRTEADEVTYGLHIILRFELESDFMAGRLSVKDIPAAWNEKMASFLGLIPPDDRRGCLQDIHWSQGLIGYFPSYALGNLYAAQFWDTMQGELSGLDTKIAAGDIAPVLSWLRKHVHKDGAAWLPGEIVQRATGEALDARHYVKYLNDKYSKVYGF
jgi:carboxypeptidase Taq